MKKVKPEITGVDERIMKRAVHHVHTVRTDPESDEYGTPKWLYNWACHIYGIYPNLDTFASDINHVCDKYYTKKDDAFTKNFDEDFFGNFPYSLIYECMEKAWDEHKENNVNALMIVNAQTGARWFREFVTEKQKEFGVKRVAWDTHPQRVKFLDNTGKIKKHVNRDGVEKENTAMYYSAWVRYYAVA